MNNIEFSNRFDTLLLSHRSQSNVIGEGEGILEIDEYQKSVFLTQAQNIIVNSLLKDFEKTEDIRRKLSVLVKTYTVSVSSSTDTLDDDNIILSIPSNVKKIIIEKVKIQSNISCYNNKDLTITPITHDDYLKQLNNPFRKPKLSGLTTSAWRLDKGDIDNIIEISLPSGASFVSYMMRYIKTPDPIVLVDLPEDLSIEGVNSVSQCELDSFLLQQQILELAVQMAISAITKLAPK